jgi:hypothetical protein
LPRQVAASRIALVCAALIGLCVAGCANRTQVFQNNNESWFSKPFITTPDWAKPDSIARTPDLGPRGPVGAENLVGADGRCAMTQTAQAMAPPVVQPPADRPVGSVAGDLAGAPMPPMAAAPPVAEPGTPPVLGGIALGMTECQAVERAGTPANVAITGGDHGERNVVLTYLSGPWPGIYRFSDGRLKVIDRAPVPPEAPKLPPKKKTSKKPVKPTAAKQSPERTFVQ